MDHNPLKIFIGNLPFTLKEDGLQELFARFGDIQGVNVRKDRDSGRPKGFGFVTFIESDSASEAISKMNGYVFEGRTLTVRPAEARGTAAAARDGVSAADAAWKTVPAPRKGSVAAGAATGGASKGGGGSKQKQQAAAGASQPQRKTWDHWAGPT